MCTNHNSKDTVGSSGDGVTRTSILCGEQFRSDGVKHPIHNVAGKAVGAVPPEKGVGCSRSG